MGGQKWTSEKILSISAIFISVCTLIVFLYQTNLIRKQQYMSVFPYIQIGNYGVGSPYYKYVIRNDGIGPALIKSINITDKHGKSYSDIVDYVNSTISEKDSIGFYYANITKGRLIPEKDFVEVIVVDDKKIKSSEHLHNILNANGVNVEIEYESIYGESWLITNKMISPEKK